MQIDTILHDIVSSRENEIWIALLTLIAYFILKKKPFEMVTFYFERSDKHYDFARTLLMENSITNEARDDLIEIIEKGAFMKYRKINADREMRLALSEFQKVHGQSITWTQIRRALPYINLIEGHLAIKFRLRDHISRRFITIFSFIASLYLILPIVVAIGIYDKASWYHLLGLAASFLMLLFVVIGFSSLNWPYLSAKAIQDEIHKTNHHREQS